MIKVGKRQKLVINNFSSVGAYLFAGTDDDKDNILLPNNEIEGKDLKEGDEVEDLLQHLEKQKHLLELLLN